MQASHSTKILLRTPKINKFKDIFKDKSRTIGHHTYTKCTQVAVQKTKVPVIEWLQRAGLTIPGTKQNWHCPRTPTVSGLIVFLSLLRRSSWLVICITALVVRKTVVFKDFKDKLWFLRTFKDRVNFFRILRNLRTSGRPGRMIILGSLESA